MRLSRAWALAAVLGAVHADLSPALLELVRSNLASSAAHSWEYGARAEAELEYSYPALSIFGSNPFGRVSASPPQAVLDLVRPIIAARPAGYPLIDGDGSSGDPASLSAATLLTSTFDTSNASIYRTAVTEQNTILLNGTIRGPNGIISARDDELSLWSDWMYMAPPALAYLGAFTQNKTQLTIGYTQSKLYYDALKTSNGLVQHIKGTGHSDSRPWSTGCAWAAAGMVRVLATIDASPFKSSMSKQRRDLVNKANAILTAAYGKRNATTMGMLDYLLVTKPPQFSDPASSALFVATSYRLATMGYSTTTVAKAEQTRLFVESQVSADGWVLGAVDPFKGNRQLPLGEHSPESQAFVLMMAAAQRDWRAAGCPGVAACPAAATAKAKSKHASRMARRRRDPALLGIAALTF